MKIAVREVSCILSVVCFKCRMCHDRVPFLGQIHACLRMNKLMEVLTMGTVVERRKKWAELKSKLSGSKSDIF